MASLSNVRAGTTGGQSPNEQAYNRRLLTVSSAVRNLNFCAYAYYGGEKMWQNAHVVVPKVLPSGSYNDFGPDKCSFWANMQGESGLCNERDSSDSKFRGSNAFFKMCPKYCIDRAQASAGCMVHDEQSGWDVVTYNSLYECLKF